MKEKKRKLQKFEGGGDGKAILSKDEKGKLTLFLNVISVDKLNIKR